MNPPRSSHQRYRGFVQDYKHKRLDDGEEKTKEAPKTPEPGGLMRGKRREYLRDYLRWLWPHRYAVGGVFLLALTTAGLEMIEPLFMRFIIDRVLLNVELDRASRLQTLHLAGSVFVAIIVLSNGIRVLKDYRQRLLNVQVMLTLRRTLFDRLLHLPLPRLWDMKTGGILSRLTGDVETTTGLLQMAVMSPTISVVRLIIAVTVLMLLNWRLALTALAIIPGVMVISFSFTRRIRPIYRSVRKDAEIDRWARRRDVLGDSCRAGLRPRDARALRLHARPAHGPAQGALRAPPGAAASGRPGGSCPRRSTS